jgi:hypothetical protein
MCTVIAKETPTRVVVLTGIPCCLCVDDVTPSIPKVTAANGWFQLYAESIDVEVPRWASWLVGGALTKALAGRHPRCRGKKVYFYDVSDRYVPVRGACTVGSRFKGIPAARLVKYAIFPAC